MRFSGLCYLLYPILTALLLITAGCGGGNSSSSGSGNPPTSSKTTPSVTWPQPAAITYPAPLTSTQLDATANVAGTFTYNPAVGTILSPGNQTLSATFAPNDTTDYNSATASVTLTVNSSSSGNPPQGFIVDAETTFENASGDTNGVYGVYQFNSSPASLQEVSTTSENNGAPWAIGLDPNGPFIYTASGPCCPGVNSPFAEAFSLNISTGALTAIAGSPFAAGTFADMLAVAPGGEFLYYNSLSAGGTPGIAAYGIASNGVPTALAGSPFATPVGDSGMALTSDGRFLFTVPQTPKGSSQIYTFSINSSGALTQVAQTTVSSSPTSVVAMNAVQIPGSGNFVFVACDSTIAVFNLNTQSGQLTPVSGSPFSVSGPISSFAINSSGAFLYAAQCAPPAITDPAGVFCGSSSALAAYSVNPVTGEITAASTQLTLPASYTYPSITSSGALVFAATTLTETPSSDYTGWSFAGRIGIYAVNASSGALTYEGSVNTSGAPVQLVALMPNE